MAGNALRRARRKPRRCQKRMEGSRPAGRTPIPRPGRTCMRPQSCSPEHSQGFGSSRSRPLVTLLQGHPNIETAN